VITVECPVCGNPLELRAVPDRRTAWREALDEAQLEEAHHHVEPAEPER
jgi:hypothetical protein